MKTGEVLVIFGSYFLHRVCIRAYFSYISKTSAVIKIRNASSFFLRTTGLYLLKCKNGINKISYIIVILIAFEILFLPSSAIVFSLIILNIINFNEIYYIIKIMFWYIWIVWQIMTVLFIYIMKTKKQK